YTSQRWCSAMTVLLPHYPTRTMKFSPLSLHDALPIYVFARGPWGAKFPTVVASWRRAWEHVIPFFAFPPDVRRLIYTTNALESRSEEHTSELQSLRHLVCRLLGEIKERCGLPLSFVDK